jgi:UTP--glucose-1-phosphate uridylyltransferase
VIGTLRKVVIPAAGLGTRFLPATKAVPKEMLPIVDTPTIQLIVEEAVAAGATQIVLVNGRQKGAIEDHFDRSFELEATLTEKNKKDLFDQVRRISDLARVISVRQKEPLGLGHAVLAAQPAVGDEWFGVCLGDDFYDSKEPAIGQLWKVAREQGKAAIALMPVARGQEHLYGIAAGKKGAHGHLEIEKLVEKPKMNPPTNLAVIGRYVLPPEIWGILQKLKPGVGGEIQLTDALDVLASQGKLLGVELQGTRHDAGDRLGYLQANIAYGLKRPELRDGLLAYLRETLKREGAA